MGKKGEKNNRRGVLICGAYGMGNAGDEAILDAIISEMRSIDPDMPICVLSRTPEKTAAKHSVQSLHTFDLPAILREMRRKKLYINGGGSLIQDVTSSRSLWYYLYTLVAAHHRGCRVLMYGCGVGPVNRPRNRRLAGRIMQRHVDIITLREEHSLSELLSMGVTRPRIIVASDPALSLSPAGEDETDEFMASLGLDKNERYLCFCLRAWPGYREKAEEFAAAADYAAEKYGLRPLFLSVNHIKDGQASRLAADATRAPALCVQESMSTSLVVGLISRMRAVVAMRLHALIFASGVGVPVAGVSYDPKVAAFMDYIGLENYIDFSDMTASGLCRLIDKAMETDPGELKASAERLRKTESANVEAARELLEL